MKLCNLLIDGKRRLGLVTERGVIDVSAAGLSMSAVIAGADREELEALAAENMAPVVENPVYDNIVDQAGKLICVGLNYREHAAKAGLPISPESYNAAGVNAFIDCEKSNVNFDWVDVDKFDQKSASDSYAIFNGEKEPEKILPVIPTPSPAPSPAPSASPKPFVPPAYLLITKNPTNENRKPGSTALFVAGANAINSLTWTFVSPNGGEYSVQSFAWNFPNARVSGQYSTTLSVANVSLAGYEPLGRVLHLLLQQSDRTHEHGLYQHDQRSHPVAQADDPADARAYRAAHYGPDRAAHYGPDRAAHRGADGTAHRRPRAYAGAGARTNRRSGA